MCVGAHSVLMDRLSGIAQDAWEIRTLDRDPGPWLKEGKVLLRRESQTQGSFRRLYSSSISTNAGQGLHPAAPEPDSPRSSPVTGYNSAVHMEGINTSLEYYIIICYL